MESFQCNHTNAVTSKHQRTNFLKIFCIEKFKPMAAGRYAADTLSDNIQISL